MDEEEDEEDEEDEGGGTRWQAEGRAMQRGGGRTTASGDAAATRGSIRAPLPQPTAGPATPARGAASRAGGARQDTRPSSDRPSDGGSRPESSPPASFVWRPVAPRGSAGASAARTRASQQEQREKLLARLFPGESTASSPSAVSPRSGGAGPKRAQGSPSTASPTPSRTVTGGTSRGTPSSSLPSIATPTVESPPAEGHEDLRDIDGGGDEVYTFLEDDFDG